MGLKEINDLKLAAKLPKQKNVYRIPKKSAKKIAQEKTEKENRNVQDSELLKWYKGRQKFLSGKCSECGAKYNPTILKNAIMATAHILPKRNNMFPSIATDPLNFWEASPYCGCHHKYDSLLSWEEITQMKIWGLISERFIMVEPNISPEERKKIPKVFLDVLANRGTFP